MDNLLNNVLKYKRDCFKKLTQMELFRSMDESMGALMVPLVPISGVNWGIIYFLYVTFFKCL